MARPNHQIRQPASHHNYLTNHTRNVAQGLIHGRGPRHAHPRNVMTRNHHQNNPPTHVVGVPSEPANAGQSVLFPPFSPANLHVNHDQQSLPMYSVSNQITPFPSQQGSQQYFAGYPPPILVPHNMIPYQGSHHPQMTPFCLPPSSQVPNPPIHQNVCGENNVSLQVTQPSHNISPPIMPVQNNNSANATYKKLKTRPNALMDIIDPATGRNVAEDIYRSAATSPPVKNEKPSIIRITHPNLTQRNKPPKVFPKLSITISPSSTLSTTTTSSHSESLSPIPLSTSSRLNSPDKSSSHISSNPENQEVSSTIKGDNNVKTAEESNCVETLEIQSNNHSSTSDPLTSVPEEHCSQSQTDSQNNEQSCHHENESDKTSEEPIKTEEKKAEVAVPPKTVGSSKNNNGKSQKKKNKRKSKNRDLNRNQLQNSSTSSEESTSSNVRVESSSQDVKETNPTVIPDIKEEEESIVENIKPIVCDQNNIKNELNVKSEPEDCNESKVNIKIENLVDNQQPQDLKQLELSNEESVAPSETKIEKCDIKIEAPSLENVVKLEKEDVKEDLSSQEININDIKSGPIEIPGDIFSFETTKTCVINDGPDQCYIRGANGINFFFNEMFEDIAESNQNQSQEQQIDNKAQNLSQHDNEIEKEQKDIELDHQKDIDIKSESQKDVDVESELQRDTEVEPEQEINTEVEPEQEKGERINQEQSDCRELEEGQTVIHKMEEIPELRDDKCEEQSSNTEIKNDEKQNDGKLPGKIEVEEKRRFIKPPAYGNRRMSLGDVPGRKMYSREFLVDMKDKEECWIRPDLPDVDIVRHNIKRPSQNSSAILSSRDRSHEFLFPSFSRSSFNTKAAPTNRRSFQGKSKPHKQAIIHVSLSLNEDIKLRQTENAWKPSLLQKGKSKEENNEDTVLFKKMRSVLNKLTPEKFDNLVEQVKQLEINSLEQLKGIIDILFQKAIDEPLYSTYYALMCKELSDKSIPDNEKKEKKINLRILVIENCQKEFEKHLTAEYEQNQKAKTIERLNEDDDKKKKELELEEERSKTKRRCLGNIKFVGELYKQKMIKNEIMILCIETLLKINDEESLESLCKLLTTIGKILDEKISLSSYFQSLEKLIHKNKRQKFSSRIRFMIQDVIELRNNKWIPRRRENNPQTMGQIQKEVETERIINDTPLPTSSQSYPAHKEFITPRKDERDSNNDRRRSCARSSSSVDEGGWNSVRNNRNRPSDSLSIKREKLNIKPPAAEETTFGSRSSFVFNQTAEKNSFVVAPNRYASLDNIMKHRRSSIASSDPPKEFRPEFKPSWTYGSSSRSENQRVSLDPVQTRDSLSIPSPAFSVSRTPTPPTLSPSTFVPISRTPTPPLTSSSSVDTRNSNLPVDEKKLRNLVKSLLDESSSSDVNLFMKNAQETIEDKFNTQSYPLLIEEALNSVLERNQMERQRFSTLLAQLIKDEIIPLSVFQAEFEKLLEIADDLVIDIPQCWEYFAEILAEMVAINAHPFIELTRTLAILKNTGKCGKLLGELLSILTKEKTPKWVIDNWNQSGLEWTNLINSECEKVDLLEKYNLEFLVEGINNNGGKLSENKMTLEQISEYLLKLLKEENFDNITSWISLNVGEQSKQPQFVRCLVTDILKTSIEAIDESWRLKSETFCKLLPLITRYVDAKRDLELQCLYAIQSYNYELMYPQGILSKIIDHLCDQYVLSDDAFIEWGKTENPNERNGHAVAIKTLTSFFTKLREAERDDSSE